MLVKRKLTIAEFNFFGVFLNVEFFACTACMPQPRILEQLINYSINFNKKIAKLELSSTYQSQEIDA